MAGWSRILCSMMAMVTSLTLGCCTGVIDQGALAQNQREGKPPNITFAGDIPPWADNAAATMDELETWRGLPFLEDLQVTFQPQTDPNLNGWYNSETQQLVVTVGGSEQLGRGVLLHEIFHALQDQHFDLYQLRLNSLGQPDYDQALSALIEGEAMLAVSELMNYDFLAHAQLPIDGDVSEAQFENLFIYGDGLKFIQAVRDAGGWAAVDAAFTDPPQATTLIFNPERYLAGEREARLLATPLKQGETLQDQRVEGEYELRRLLAQSSDTRSLLEQVKTYYWADTLGIVQTAEGQVIHRWVVEFTDGAVTEELEAWVSGFTTALARHYDLAEPPVVSISESTIVAEW